jgi:hypothetical protein
MKLKGKSKDLIAPTEKVIPEKRKLKVKASCCLDS